MFPALQRLAVALLLLLALPCCTGPRSTRIEGRDGAVWVSKPPPEVRNTNAYAEVKDIALKGKDLLNGNAEVGLQLKRLQMKNPDLLVKELLLYELALVYANGDLTLEQYGHLARDLFNPPSAHPTNCWEGDRWKETRENIDWVMWKDAGAMDRYRKARSGGLSIFQSLKVAQSHNSHARRTIEDLGSDCVEQYVRTVYADRQ